MPFQKAVKFDSKLRLSLSGPSGSGKTYTALVLASALANGAPIALIDTERGSASKYADLFSFDVMELDSFHPDKFIQGIHDAEAAGYAVLVIDSLSHAWNGTGGLLEIVETITKRSSSKNSYTAWAEATPIQNRLIDAITRAKLHIIVTMRSKAEYVIEKDERTNKTAPRKVGMAPIQRDGMEYEFDVAADLDIDNTLIVQKSRCPALSGQVISKPDSRVADILKTWLSGAPAPARVDADPAEVERVRVLIGRVFGFADEDFEARWDKCKRFVLKAAIADPDLQPQHLEALSRYATAQQEKHAAPQASAA